MSMKSTHDFVQRSALMKTVTIAIAFCVCSIMIGCSTTAVPDKLSIKNRFEKSVNVVVNSDFQSNPLISRNRFIRSALCSTLEKNGPFARVLEADTGDYRLEIHETKVTPPPMGFFSDITMSSEMTWTLKASKTNTQLWQSSIKSEYTATMSESLFSWLGAVRVMRASSGVVRENIKSGVEQLSKVSL